jgi:hypothetical protein
MQPDIVPLSLTPVANLPSENYLREFSKKFEMIGAWGKVIHEKNLKQKIS